MDGFSVSWMSVLSLIFAIGDKTGEVPANLFEGALFSLGDPFFLDLPMLGGAIWFLQGINVLPGSFMTGQTRWAVYGAIAIAVGIAFFLRANRRGKS